MNSHDERERRRVVLEEVGVGESLLITDPARLFRLLASRKKSGQEQEAQRLLSLAEQLEERGVR